MNISKAAALEHYQSVIVLTQRELHRHLAWCNVCTEHSITCGDGRRYEEKLSVALGNLRKAEACK